MVSDYPNCTYEGCDIEDVTNKRLSLKQTHFRTGNVLQGLPYPDNSFDFVHMRLLILAFKVEEWPMAIDEILRVTKPGGMIQLLEFDLKACHPLANHTRNPLMFISLLDDRQRSSSKNSE